MRASRAMLVLAILFAFAVAGCGGDDNTSASPTSAASGTNNAGARDPCKLLTTDDVTSVIDARADGEFSVAEPPSEVAGTCNWNIDFPGLGSSFVQIGLIDADAALTQQDAARASGELPLDIPGVGDKAQYVLVPNVGNTLHVTQGNRVLVLHSGELLGRYVGDDNEYDLLVEAAKVALPRV